MSGQPRVACLALHRAWVPPTCITAQTITLPPRSVRGAARIAHIRSKQLMPSAPTLSSLSSHLPRTQTQTRTQYTVCSRAANALRHHPAAQPLSPIMERPFILDGLRYSWLSLLRLTCSCSCSSRSPSLTRSLSVSSTGSKVGRLWPLISRSLSAAMLALCWLTFSPTTSRSIHSLIWESYVDARNAPKKSSGWCGKRSSSRPMSSTDSPSSWYMAYRMLTRSARDGFQ
mmetsp:Transcript_232/g.539  ORF Transcript_232/g.539 Transcript_232/m.539 type:complete len:229 (+) Transcript_232:151-837(+)